MSNTKKILSEAVEKHLVSKLNEYGFKYFEKSISFKRKVDDFTNEIYFTGEKTNFIDAPNSTMNCINFNCHFQIKSPRLKSWYKKNFLEIPPVEFINPDLKSDKEMTEFRHSFDFIKEKHIDIMNEIYSNFVNHYETYFNKFSDWKSLVENGQGDSKIDYLIMGGNLKQANELCETRLSEVEAFHNSEEFKTKCNKIPSYSMMFDSVLLNLKLKRKYILDQL